MQHIPLYPKKYRLPMQDQSQSNWKVKPWLYYQYKVHHTGVVSERTVERWNRAVDTIEGYQGIQPDHSSRMCTIQWLIGRACIQVVSGIYSEEARSRYRCNRKKKEERSEVWDQSPRDSSRGLSPWHWKCKYFLDRRHH